MKKIVGLFLSLSLIVVSNIQALTTKEVQNWADSLQQAITEAERSLLEQLNQNEINQTIFKKSDLTQDDLAKLITVVEDLKSGSYSKRKYSKPSFFSRSGKEQAIKILDNLVQNVTTAKETWLPSRISVRQSTRQQLKADQSDLISKFLDRAKTIIQTFEAQPEQVTTQFISAKPITSAEPMEEQEVSPIPFRKERKPFKRISPRRRTFLKIPK